MLKKKEVKQHHHSQLSKSTREIKAKILKELAAEKALEGPHVSDEPTFTKVEEAYERFSSIDITCETIPTTIERIKSFLDGVFADLVVESIDMLTKVSEEEGLNHNSQTSKPAPEQAARSGNSSNNATTSITSATANSPAKTKLPTLGKSLSDQGKSVTLDTKATTAAPAARDGDAVEDQQQVKTREERIADIQDTLTVSFEKVTLGICDKVTEFIDERIHADRHSLLREKKQAQNKLFAAKEVSELYRRSYDQQHRYRKQEEIRVLNDSWSRKYKEDTGELKDKIEHLQFQVRLTSNKLKEDSITMDTMKETLQEREEKIKELTVKLDLANKRSKSRPAPNHSNSHHHSGSGHGYGSNEGPRWNANHHVAGSASLGGNVKQNTAISNSYQNKIEQGQANIEVLNNASTAKADNTLQPNNNPIASNDEAAATDPGLQRLQGTLNNTQQMVAQFNSTEGEADEDKQNKDTNDAEENAEHGAHSGRTTMDAIVQTDFPPASDTLPEKRTSYDQHDDNEQIDLQQQESDKLIEMRHLCDTLRAEIKTLRQKLVTEVESNRSIVSEQTSVGLGPGSAPNPGSVGNMSPLSSRRGSPRAANSPIQSPLGPGRKMMDTLVIENDGNGDTAADGVDNGDVNKKERAGGDTDRIQSTSPTSVEQQLSPNSEMQQRSNADTMANTTREANGTSPTTGRTTSTSHKTGNIQQSPPNTNNNNMSSNTLLSPDPTLDPTADPGLEPQQSLDLLSHDDIDAKTTTSENIIRELNSNSIELTGGIPAGGEQLGVDLRYVEEIQTLGSHRHQGVRGVERYTPDSASGRRIQKLLEEAAKRENELTERLLSYDLQNTELGNNIRKRDAEREQSEKLHSLQMLERGILLKELSQQVQDLRQAMSSLEKEKSRKDKQIASLVKVIKVQAKQGSGIPEGVGVRVGTLEAAELLAAQEMREFTGRRSAEIRASHSRDKVPLKTITVDNSLTIKDEYKPASAISTGPGSTLIVDPTQSRSRLLENSKSMPVLSDEYGPYHNTGKDVRDVYINKISGTSGRLSPLYGTANTNFTSDLGLDNSHVVERELRSRSPTRHLHSRGGLGKDSRGKETAGGTLEEVPRHLSSGQAHKEALLAQEQRERDIASGADKVQEKLERERKEEHDRYLELTNVRSQIVGILSERYPSAEKRSQQILAADRAKQRALEGRALALKNKAVPKKIHL